MENAEPLIIIKTRHYVWRKNLGGAHHGWMEAWNVTDASGNMLAGGYEGGSNVKSGRATLARKSWAKAFIEGWRAFREGRLTEEQAQAVHLSPDRFPSPRYSEQERNWFREGAYRSFRGVHPQHPPAAPVQMPILPRPRP